MPETPVNPMQDMSQLYARVFVTILDSSIAEDFTIRHVFEDLFKLVNHKTGIVDMTRQAIARRLNLPLDVLNNAISRLESPDPNSRDMEFEGRRIARLDEHRDWGWRILNWAKYDEIRTKADNYLRVSKHRDKVAEESGKFKKPVLEEVKLQFAKVGMPMSEAEKFFDYYESNGWRVGKNPMKSWTCAVANWKRNYDERKYTNGGRSAGQSSANRDVGTLNEGKAGQYRGVGRVVQVPDAQRPAA